MALPPTYPVANEPTTLPTSTQWKRRVGRSQTRTATGAEADGSTTSTIRSTPVLRSSSRSALGSDDNPGRHAAATRGLTRSDEPATSGRAYTRTPPTLARRAPLGE